MRRIALILLTVVMFGLSAYARRLTAFLPEPDKANGAAVIVCPGGSYYWLSRKIEGTEVAQKLAEAGFTAFVLHYRHAGTPAQDISFSGIWQFLRITTQTRWMISGKP